MGVSANIDWISATFPYHLINKKWQVAVLPQESELAISTKARNGYSEAYKLPSGCTLMLNHDRRDMGLHVTYSAQAIARVSDMYSVSQDVLLGHILVNGKITRLDVAYDVSDIDIDIRKLYEGAKSGKIATKAKSFGYVESAKSGKEQDAKTAYIGSMKKRKKLLRIYDKGTQLGLEKYLTRFELEMRGQISQNAAKMLKSTDFCDYGNVIAGMIKAYADFAKTSVSEFFEVDKVPVSLPKYRKSDTAKWLLDVVSKTLANETWEDASLFPLFIERFKEHYQEIADSIAPISGGV